MRTKKNEIQLEMFPRISEEAQEKAENHNSTPRVRFEAIAVGVHLALKENPNLIPVKPVTTWLESTEFQEQVTTDAANNRNKLLGRILFVKDKLLGQL